MFKSKHAYPSEATDGWERESPKHTHSEGIPQGGHTIGPYADSLPLSNQFQGWGGGGRLGLGVWGRLKGRGAPGPQHIWFKMTP